MNTTKTKSANIQSLIRKINEAYEALPPINDAASFAQNIKSYEEASARFDALVAELQSAGNDIKFDYLAGKYFAAYDVNGREVFVSYVKTTTVYRRIGSAPTAEAAEKQTWAEYYENEVEQVDDLTTQTIEVI